MRVLQDLAEAIQTLARLWPDLREGSWFSRLPGGTKPLTIRGQGKDIRPSGLQSSLLQGTPLDMGLGTTEAWVLRETYPPGLTRTPCAPYFRPCGR